MLVMMIRTMETDDDSMRTKIQGALQQYERDLLRRNRQLSRAMRQLASFSPKKTGGEFNHFPLSSEGRTLSLFISMLCVGAGLCRLDSNIKRVVSKESVVLRHWGSGR